MGSGGSSSAPRGGSSSGPGIGPTSGGTSTGSGAGTGATDSGGSTAPGNIQSGSLTAGTWDDNLNFAFDSKYLKRVEGQQLGGLPRIPRADRMEILVMDGSGTAIPGATITVGASSTGGAANTALQAALFTAPTHPDGRLFFFPGWAGAAAGTDLIITATLGTAIATASAKAGDNNVALTLAAATAAPPTAIELALVIDTTGSMGDEMDYLKVELSAISARIAADFPDVTQRWALVLYRDDGDQYVVRKFDFTTSITTFQSQLTAQSAGGGGDYPEAPERALAQMAALQWSPGAVARLAFWLADAPHHAGREQQLVNALSASARAGIAIYPIAASGVDDLAEFSMRTAAQVTGGRYLFLTDDSGIGLSHAEPSIPCYLVTTLAKAMHRMISIEYTGRDIQPVPVDVLRTGGDPQDGRCTLADGDQVVPF